jgi:hypothetical protein
MVAAGNSMAMNDAYITVFEAMTKPMVTATEARTRSIVTMETWSRLTSISPSRIQ